MPKNQDQPRENVDAKAQAFAERAYRAITGCGKKTASQRLSKFDPAILLKMAELESAGKRSEIPTLLAKGTEKV